MRHNVYQRLLITINGCIEKLQSSNQPHLNDAFNVLLLSTLRSWPVFNDAASLRQMHFACMCNPLSCPQFLIVSG